jgi:hypothetical protein
MNIRKPVDRLDPATPIPACGCTAADAERAKALADIRGMATDTCATAGSNKALVDFCLDVINRTRGL